MVICLSSVRSLRKAEVPGAHAYPQNQTAADDSHYCRAQHPSATVVHTPRPKLNSLSPAEQARQRRADVGAHSAEHEAPQAEETGKQYPFHDATPPPLRAKIAKPPLEISGGISQYNTPVPNARWSTTHVRPHTRRVSFGLTRRGAGWRAASINIDIHVIAVCKPSQLPPSLLPLSRWSRRGQSRLCVSRPGRVRRTLVRYTVSGAIPKKKSLYRKHEQPG